MELNQKHSLSLASLKALKWNAFSNCSFNNNYFLRLFLPSLVYLLKFLLFFPFTVKKWGGGGGGGGG